MPTFKQYIYIYIYIYILSVFRHVPFEMQKKRGKDLYDMKISPRHTTEYAFPSDIVTCQNLRMSLPWDGAAPARV